MIFDYRDGGAKAVFGADLFAEGRGCGRRWFASGAERLAERYEGLHVAARAEG